ncbi:MAG TPA: arginase family protein [Anaerolineales bacterium]|nr:arginase family protein [Anaerolineales bacterium]
MDVQLIQVPYDSGHKDMRTGRGPGHFLQHGLDEILQNQGHTVGSEQIEAKTSFTTEVGTAFELNRLLAEKVRQARERGSLPIVLAGNCNSCLGTIAGIGEDHLGVIWLDAHGDFNTPETTLSGFFDGMGLAIAAGRCWKSLVGTIPGFRAISEENIVHIGARDLDVAEEQMMRQSQLELVPVENIHGVIGSVLERLSKKVKHLYLHVDMDILDAGEALPNHLAVPGGLMVDDVEEIIGRIKKQFEICAGAITSFDPDYDKEDQVLHAGIRIINAFAA